MPVLPCSTGTIFAPNSACLTALHLHGGCLFLFCLCYLWDKVAFVMQVKDAAPDLNTYPQSGLVCTQSATGKRTKKCTRMFRNTQTEERETDFSKDKTFPASLSFNRWHRFQQVSSQKCGCFQGQSLWNLIISVKLQIKKNTIQFSFLHVTSLLLRTAYFWANLSSRYPKASCQKKK